ncbi:single-strand DNA endonuclease ASTE1-like [Salminus brasiliensis]|uniref:single-strand DNA endonuclease ASTE1-like n=1 Tax=Salminus brasiliensis TaxID=930266 RepID=UPI003B837B82
MGVQGLTSYIENNDLLKSRAFRESKLIIDGSNLYYNLYFRSSLDQAHGGEYDAFKKVVSDFFRSLELCQIEPYVVLDGGDDISDKKFKTLKKRAEDRIKRTNALSRGRSGESLPVLIKNVFRQILRKLEVPFIQCIAEADWEAAALAKEWNCPVLSNDSDFYIFNINGFLPIAHFEWRRVRTHKKSGKHFLQTKCFSVNNLYAAFNIKQQLLPIFATILGNDYANLDKQLLPNWSKFSLCPGGTSRIDGLLRWLSKCQSPDEAIRKILSHITDPKDSAVVYKVLTQGLQDYRLTPSSIAQFFRSGAPQCRLPPPLQRLPQWFLKAMAEGRLSSILLDVLTLHRVTLNFAVQDFSLGSNNLTSRPIRQVIYGLMLAPRRRNNAAAAAAQRERFEVEEYDRQGLTLTSSKVVAILPRQVIPDVHLETLLEVPLHVRQQVFLDALCASQVPDRLLVPPSLQLAVYVTCYWLKHAQPEPRPEFFGALLVGLVYGELSRDLVTQKEVGSELKRLKRLKRRGEQTPLDLEAAHAFSQWQSSLKDSICLNQLLANPVPEPEYAWLYSGLFVHRVVRELRRGITPESLLAGAPDAMDLYHELRNAAELQLVGDMVQRMRVTAIQVQLSGSTARQDPMDNITNMFDHLRCEEEEDDDDDLLRRGEKGKGRKPGDDTADQPCTSRTRHKKRIGTKDPKSKKYERSSW